MHRDVIVSALTIHPFHAPPKHWPSCCSLSKIQHICKANRAVSTREDSARPLVEASVDQLFYPGPDQRLFKVVTSAANTI